MLMDLFLSPCLPSSLHLAMRAYYARPAHSSPLTACVSNEFQLAGVIITLLVSAWRVLSHFHLSAWNAVRWSPSAHRRWVPYPRAFAPALRASPIQCLRTASRRTL